MSKLLKKTDGKLTRDQQARRYALVMLLLNALQQDEAWASCRES